MTKRSQQMAPLRHLGFEIGAAFEKHLRLGPNVDCVGVMRFEARVPDDSLRTVDQMKRVTDRKSRHFVRV